MDKTPPKEIEYRTTFVAPITELSNVRTAIEAQAFLLNIIVSTERIGGLVQQTWGLRVKGKEAQMVKFQTWLNDNLPALCKPENSLVSRMFN